MDQIRENPHHPRHPRAIPISDVEYGEDFF
jgi:hypothetical protein